MALRGRLVEPGSGRPPVKNVTNFRVRGERLGMGSGSWLGLGLGLAFGLWLLYTIRTQQSIAHNGFTTPTDY